MELIPLDHVTYNDHSSSCRKLLNDPCIFFKTISKTHFGPGLTCDSFFLTRSQLKTVYADSEKLAFA